MKRDEYEQIWDWDEVDMMGNNSEHHYRFKYYFCDNSTRLSDCSGNSPESLFEDFDGLMDWDEFDNLSSKKLTTHEILELANKLYKGRLEEFYRIEIINDKTNEVIDYIEEKR